MSNRRTAEFSLKQHEGEPQDGNVGSLSSRVENHGTSPVDIRKEDVGSSEDHSFGMTPTTAVNPDASYTTFSDTSEYEEIYLPKASRNSSRNYSRSDKGSYFERPAWKRLAVHILACVCTYPAAYSISVAANDKSIFWARFIVGLGSGILGIILSSNLHEFAKWHLEASSE